MLHNDKELAAKLREVKRIAIVGAVDKPGRPVDMVGKALMEMGYEVVPVHPKRTDVWGLETYPTLLDIPFAIDVVDLFRASQFIPEHAREVLQMKTLPKFFWMQSGITSPEARELLADTDITIVEDRCIKIEIPRLGVK